MEENKSLKLRKQEYEQEKGGKLYPTQTRREPFPRESTGIADSKRGEKMQRSRRGEKRRG